MAALVVPSIVRCTATGRIIDDRWACVTDLFVVEGIDGVPSGPDRESQIRQATDRLWDAWYILLGELSDQLFLDSIEWVDLDLADGMTGSKTGTTSHPGPLQGRSTSAPSPSNVAMIATKVEQRARRGVRTGRMFIPGVRASMITGNTLEASDRTAVQAALDGFVDEVNNDGSGTSAASSELRTVHVPRTGDPFSSAVTKLQLRSRVTHQDRRINRY